MARILALMTDAFGGHGGISQYNRDLVTSLAGNGHSVTILPRHARDPVGVLPRGAVQHKAHPGRAAYALNALVLALRVRPDVVLCGHLFMSTLAALVARAVGARLVVQLHGIEAWEEPGNLCRLSIEKARLVLCVSRYTRDRVLSWAALAPERVAVLPNTVRDIFAPSDRGPSRVRFGLVEKTVLLSVGRVDARERYKGYDRAIKAVSSLRDSHPDLLYVICGEGDDQPRLEALVTRCGVEAHVRFLGEVHTQDLPDLYRAADLFILPSTGEGFGIVFLEAMASGTPALGLAVAGARDALGDGALGIMVDPEKDLAIAIRDALASPRRDPVELATEVTRRFSKVAFASRVNSLMIQATR